MTWGTTRRLVEAGGVVTGSDSSKRMPSALAVVLFILVLVCVLPIQRLARGDEA